MAIILNDNIKINAGKPSESKYLTTTNTAYPSNAAVNIAIPISERYVGLTVNVNNIEFWYKEGVADGDLIEKKYDTPLPTSDYVTGATNIGYFSGYTGVQTLPIDHLTNSDYDGNYYSVYNYYYRDTDGVVRVGIPTDGIPRRGYVKTSGLIKSWIWNEYLGGSDLLGWILIDGDISKLIGTFQYSGIPPYYNGTTKFPYSATTWTTGSAYNNGSNLVVNTVHGGLTTGNTITIGGRPFARKEHNNLHFRTVISETPTVINVRDDDTFIYVSGVTSMPNAKNLGTIGVSVYSGTTGTTFLFKRLIGSGSTIITDFGNSVVINSTGGTGGFYNLSSPSSISLGGIPSGTTLTGKTAFELFEELLVPTLYPTLTNPSIGITMSPSGIFEIGTIIPTICVTGAFNAGCINPQYTASCGKRSCGASAYYYVGAQIGGCYADTNTSRTEYVTSYSVCSGVQTWNVKASYQVGVQPYDSKGSYYCTPLPIGETSTVAATITGILPWYWGLSTSMSVNALCIANRGRDGLGCKCVGDVFSTPIPITFNSNSSDYIWFALPSCSSDKTCWCVNSTNNGCIGGGGNLFSNYYTTSVTSTEACWIGCNYDVYVSCYKSGTATGVPMYIS